MYTISSMGFGRAQRTICVLLLGATLAFPAVASPFESSAVDANPVSRSVYERGVQANALLAIDQNRTTVVDRIVSEWGATLSRSSAGISSAQLHTMLMGLRADHLLAASLAGSLTGLRDVLANSLSSTTAVKSPRLHATALGDTNDDLVYTPVSPCRLFDTRPAQGGIGVMTPNARRTYGATTPVANQGGPGGCNAPIGAAVALIQIGTLTPSGNGYLQGGAQGVASFPNALILYQAGDQYGTAVAMPLNVANGQFDVQVQFAATDLYGDLLGYFKAPGGIIGDITQVIAGTGLTGGGMSGAATIDIANGGVGNAQLAGGSVDVAKLNTTSTDARYFKQGGNAFGATAVIGTTDNKALEISVNGARVMRYEPTNQGPPNIIGGNANNMVGALLEGQTISGGGGSVNTCYDPVTITFTRSCGNRALNTYATVAGGYSNHASGFGSIVSGGSTNTAGGFYSSVPGGIYNVASGDRSLAAGSQAMTQTGGPTPTIHHGAFVWADNNDFNFHSAAPNEFAVRATGGARFVTAIDGVGNPYRTLKINDRGELDFGSQNRQMLNLWGPAEYGIGIQSSTLYFRTNPGFSNTNTGGFSWFRGGSHNDSVNNPGGGVEVMRLASNGTLYVTNGTVGTLSDRSAKDDFTMIDPADMLDRVARLPVSSWVYKANPGVRHIGPTAQDFRAAFGLGDDDERSIATVDADGVALAAIQGLHAKLEARDLLIAEQRRKLNGQEHQLAAQQREFAEQRALLAALAAKVERLGAWAAKVESLGTTP